MKEVIYIDGLDKFTAFLLAKGDDCSILLLPRKDARYESDCLVFAEKDGKNYVDRGKGEWVNLGRSETIVLAQNLNNLIKSNFESTEYKLYLKLKEKYE